MRRSLSAAPQGDVVRDVMSQCTAVARAGTWGCVGRCRQLGPRGVHPFLELLHLANQPTNLVKRA